MKGLLHARSDTCVLLQTFRNCSLHQDASVSCTFHLPELGVMSLGWCALECTQCVSLPFLHARAAVSSLESLPQIPHGVQLALSLCSSRRTCSCPRWPRAVESSRDVAEHEVKP